jgi:hypothetical protein
MLGELLSFSECMLISYWQQEASDVSRRRLEWRAACGDGGGEDAAVKCLFRAEGGKPHRLIVLC